MKTKLIFPSYETIYQHMSALSFQGKTSSPSESSLSHRIAQAFAEKTLSIKEAKAQLYRTIASGENPRFLPCLAPVIDFSLFAPLLECPNIQKIRLGGASSGSTPKGFSRLFSIINRK